VTQPVHIFFVDDDPKAGELFCRFADNSRYSIETFQSPKKALEAFKKQPCDLLITDMKMPEMTGVELLSAVKSVNPETPVIIITGYSSVDNAIQALRLGANDFIKKPYDIEELLKQIELILDIRSLRKENIRLQQALSEQQTKPTLLGESQLMQQLREMIHKLAEIRCNVIINGESGTGKELAAMDLHRLSSHADKPFVVIDCGALNDTLLESELFGHEKGAFTGADRQRIGRLENADGGSVFLDEIGNISDAMQVKLLRVVQEQQIIRVGGTHPITINVRFIVASNRNLEEMIEAGEFRHDLYHRLNVVQLQMPPLRDRRDDIPLLTRHFIQLFNKHYDRKVESFSAKSMDSLLHYDWPGNVRELRNLLERHVALAEGTKIELMSELPQIATNPTACLDFDLPDLKTLEHRYILKTLERNQNNRDLTASALGINKSTLWRKLQSYKDNDN
jgi:DNA-binding NtrC family response regulator